MACKKKRLGGVSLDRKIPWYSLPNPAIIPKPGKVKGMIWIVKHFQAFLMSE
jgi:hypothetical protein